MRHLTSCTGAALLCAAPALSQHSPIASWTPEGVQYQGYFGSSVALQGSLGLVGGRNVGERGAGFFYDLSGLEPVLLQRVDSGHGAVDYLGTAAALSGDVAVLANRYDTSVGGWSAGSVLVLERGDGGWERAERLFPLDGDAYATFGDRVALDGERLLVVSPGAFTARGRSGAVFAYERQAAGWTHVQTLYPGPSSRLQAVDLQGDLAVLGGRSPDVAGWRGVVAVYRHGASGWELRDTIEAPVPSTGFGRAVALDGARIAVGDARNDEPGHVHVYHRAAAGWVPEADLTGDEWEDQLGAAVDLQGGVLVAGAYERRIGEKSNAGAVDVWRLEGGAWQHQAELVADRLAHPSSFWFGTQLALDDHRILIGNENENGPGTAYLFHEPLGWPGCEGVPNAKGGPGRLVAQGSPAVADRRLRLEALDLLPDREAVFLAARGTGSVLNFQAGKGTLCLAEPLLRLGAGTTDVLGRAHLDVDPTRLPLGAGHVSIQPGETWWFQVLYEDVGASNLSGSLRVRFE